ncbi:hypothetical protein EBU60_06735 [bacterium]|nr:hypothetical protein [bacterium]
MNPVIWLKDFRMAGFLISRGFPMSDMRLDARGDVEISFNDEDRKVSDSLREYPQSVEFKYDTSCKVVHDLIRLKLRNGR